MAALLLFFVYGYPKIYREFKVKDKLYVLRRSIFWGVTIYVVTVLVSTVGAPLTFTSIVPGWFRQFLAVNSSIGQIVIISVIIFIYSLKYQE